MYEKVLDHYHFLAHATALQFLLQALNFASVLASGLMIWKGLGLLTNTESPIVVVLRYIFICECTIKSN